MDNIVIKTASIDDISNLNRMFASLLEYQRINFDKNIKCGLTMNSFFDKRIGITDTVIYVAKIGDKTVGYIYGYIDSDNKIKKYLEAKIESIYVEEDFRNKQIGKQLIEKFIEKVKAVGVKYITIEQMYMNQRAKYLYDKLGFSIFIETRRKEINK
jgi:ribosomal protein S18 acetylase RimI-like enzyme